ncbi:FHA domain protein [Lachnospiraceae bacterium]|nr:FHA domain protein [Lachnospiraceae bacterium]
MKINVFESHITAVPEEQDSFSLLGYRIMKKMDIPNVMPCRRILFNEEERLLFEVPAEKESLRSAMDADPGRTVLLVLDSLADILKQTEQNEFLKREYIDFSMDTIYIVPSRGKAMFLYCPIVSSDRASFGQRLYTLLEELLGDLPNYEEERVRFLLSRISAWPETDMEEVFRFIREKFGHGVTHIKGLEFRYSGMLGSFSFYVRKPEFIIGKNQLCDGVLTVSSAISRRHCRVFQQGTQYYLTDLGSRNHTYLNDRMLIGQEAVPVREGDRVRIADVEFTVREEME